MKNKSGLSDRLHPCAVYDESSRGRMHAESANPDEPAFEIDRSRILSCMAFRRLMHKTQVFVTDCGDHFRTRLTHTLEVVAQAQRLSRRLNLNPRLAGAIALAHDLGHSPFGHAGESALAQLMKDHGGFEHNVQSLRVVDYLEHPYPRFRGLNLSFELREALIKHRTKYDRPGDVAHTDESINELLRCGPQSSLEGQVANLADGIAYTLHDIEDGIVAGLLSEAALQQCSIWREAAAEIRKSNSDAPIAAIKRPILDAIADRIVDGAVSHSKALLEEAALPDVDAVRAHATELIAFSPQIRQDLDELQTCLVDSVYHNARVVRMDAKAERLINKLFSAYLGEPRLMPMRYSDRIADGGPHRVICDYIAGMTDRFCQEEYQRLFSPFHFD
jgi:dGTPase